MRVEVTVNKTTQLPAGAIEALNNELSKRLNRHFPDTVVFVRYASANGISVMGGAKEAKEQVTEILQETWESADDWFSAE